MPEMTADGLPIHPITGKVCQTINRWIFARRRPEAQARYEWRTNCQRYVFKSADTKPEPKGRD